MEFEGRILRVLPTRRGTSSKGEWMTLPFVFEYFENAEQRWSDKVLLETFDRAVMGQICKYVQRGPDGKGIYENGGAKLTGEIKCRCGFSHNVKDWDGKTYNDVRMYKFEIIEQQPTGNAAVMATQPQYQQQVAAPFQPQVVQPQQQGDETDDLPF